MNILNSKVQVSEKTPHLSDGEVSLIQDVFINIETKDKFPSITPNQIKSLTELVYNDFFFSHYSFRASEDISFMLFFTPHEDIYKHIRNATELALNAGDYKLMPPCYFGKTEVGMHWALAVVNQPILIDGASPEFRSYFLRNIHFYFNFLQKKDIKHLSLMQQNEVYENFFDLCNIFEYLPEGYVKKIQSHFPSLTEDFLGDFSKKSYDFFTEELTPLLDDKKTICIGPTKTKDWVIAKNSNNFIVYNLSPTYIHLGNPLLDVSVMPHCLDMPPKVLFERFSGNNQEIFKKLDHIYEKSWIVGLHRVLIDQIMLECFGESSHNSSLMKNAEYFTKFAGKLKNNKRFGNNTSQILSDFFLKKIL